MTNELLGTTVGKLRNKLHRLMKQRYAAEAEVKLTVEEFILLNMIEAQTDQILQNIAIATGKNKSVVMRMIDSLEEKGLAKRTVNPRGSSRKSAEHYRQGGRGGDAISGYRETAVERPARGYSGRRGGDLFPRGRSDNPTGQPPVMRQRFSHPPGNPRSILRCTPSLSGQAI